MSAADEYRVWIGCLGCYNGGDLVGGWFEADEIPGTLEEWEAGLIGPGAEVSPDHHDDGHEELWVMDHEGGMIEGEYGVTTAIEHAEFLESVEDDEADMFRAWIAYQGVTPDEDALDEARDAYQGKHDSDEDFAYETADSMGLVPEGGEWPAGCIDWGRAARELMMDYFEEGGHYFRA